jgi:hypothetical protein
MKQINEINISKIMLKHLDYQEIIGGCGLRIEAAIRDACEQTVYLCAENSTTECTNLGIRVDKKSILDTKKQII